MVIKILKFMLIGFVQGVSEILPISSSGHLILVQYFLNLSEEAIGTVVFLHFASLLALLFFTRHRLIELIKGFFMYLKDRSHLEEFKYCMYIVVSTIPPTIIALFLKDYINISSIFVVAILLIINGIMLLVFSRFNKGTKRVSDMKWYNALSIGAFECFGILPGISRSGSCISGGFLNKLDKKEAVDYAFMLFFPAIIGSIVLDFGELTGIFASPDIWYYLLAFVITLFTTYYSYKLLIKIIKKKSLTVFSIYCFIIGGITLVYCLINGIY